MSSSVFQDSCNNRPQLWQPHDFVSAALPHHSADATSFDPAADRTLPLDVLATSWLRLAIHALNSRGGGLVVVSVVFHVIVRAGWRHKFAPLELGKRADVENNLSSRFSEANRKTPGAFHANCPGAVKPKGS